MKVEGYTEIDLCDIILSEGDKDDALRAAHYLIAQAIGQDAVPQEQWQAILALVPEEEKEELSLHEQYSLVVQKLEALKRLLEEDEEELQESLNSPEGQLSDEELRDCADGRTRFPGVDPRDAQSLLLHIEDVVQMQSDVKEYEWILQDLLQQMGRNRHGGKGDGRIPG